MQSHPLHLRRAAALAGALLLAGGLSGCRPDYPRCKETAHCADRGEVCVEGLCKECGTDAECKPGYTCRDFACVQAPQCRLHADCPAGQRCRHERCVAECTEDAQCARGERCENQRCIASAECSLDEDCKDGKSCRGGRCTDGRDGLGAESEAEARRRAALAACVLERIFFEFDDHALSDAARSTLDKNAECILFQQKAVVVEGHCDERGTGEYNIVLGEKRANAVKRYLLGLGVPAARLKTVSFGDQRPLDPARTEDAFTRNRRAELQFR